MLDPKNRANKDVYQKVEAGRFKKCNGIVMNSIVRIHRNNWFDYDELKDGLQAYNLDDYEIYDALDYLESRKYIEVRESETREPVRLSDFELDEIEFKLSADGQLVGRAIKTDDGIDM